MTGIIQFETAHGIVSFEVEEEVARAAGGAGPSTARGGIVPATRTSDGIVAKVSGKLEEAFDSLKAYVGTLADVVNDLDVAPEQISVELGLKFSGSAGFVIAKAGAETEMKVALSWKP